ncbi:MAG: PTS sugar transporter subunit IIA [Deltaproteobacteria bacterium]|nr:PTS sugar transporter subunit IIA [Deltaproteobacteria bacterium]MBW2070963.1 PTS sugar transporter subunit IIA [Deltaproteobacteria bacterium]
MHLAQFLDQGHVILELQQKDRFACLQEIFDKVATDGYLRNKVQALEELCQREQLATTGIGNGIAVPHVFTDEASRPLLIMARSPSGVSFDALDGKPVHLIFVALSPRKEKDLFISLLYHLVRFLKVRQNYEDLLAAKDAAEVMAVMARAKENLMSEKLKRLVRDEVRPYKSWAGISS